MSWLIAALTTATARPVLIVVVLILATALGMECDVPPVAMQDRDTVPARTASAVGAGEEP